MTNTGVEYEILTKTIFEEILNQDDVKNIVIKHNHILKGKTAEHQIDVYWEFEIGGIKYKSIIQAKDWRTSSVNQGELFKFSCILNDLPGQPRGIFVTRKGYQKGAMKYAKANDILLYELREPTEKDWNERVRTIEIDLSFFFPKFEDTNVDIDDSWLKSEKNKLGIDEELNFTLDGESIFIDEDDNEILAVYNILESFIPTNAEVTATKKIYPFDQPVFLKTGIPSFPKVKVNALMSTISVKKKNEKIILKAEDFIGFILKNVADNSEQKFDKNIKIIR